MASGRKHHFELHSQVAPTTDGVKERSSSSPHVFILSSVPWQVLQTATKYSFGLIWCCCFTEEDIVLQNIEDLALAASTETFDSWQHVYRRRGRPDRSFSQSLAHRLSSLLVSSWTEMHRLHIKYDPMSAFSACDNPKTANAKNQFFFLISLQKVEWIWCLDGTIKQGRSQAAQSKDHTGRSKSFNTDQIKRKSWWRNLLRVKVASVIFKLFSRTNRGGAKEGLNGCVTDSLSESLWQLSILCDLHFILRLNSMDVNQRKGVTAVFFYKFWYDVPKMTSFLRTPKKLEMIKNVFPNWVSK